MEAAKKYRLFGITLIAFALLCMMLSIVGMFLLNNPAVQLLVMKIFLLINVAVYSVILIYVGKAMLEAPKALKVDEKLLQETFERLAKEELK